MADARRGDRGRGRSRNPRDQDPGVLKEELHANLIDMGFPSEQVTLALYVTGHDFDKALEWLTSGDAEKLANKAKTAPVVARDADPFSGTVSRIFETGYGFIKRLGYPDIFFHFKSVLNAPAGEGPQVGDQVTFKVLNHKDGKHQGKEHATHVKIVKFANPSAASADGSGNMLGPAGSSMHHSGGASEQVVMGCQVYDPHNPDDQEFLHGVITSLKPRYGFITLENSRPPEKLWFDRQKDVASAQENSLQESDVVRFRVENRDVIGRCAHQVEVLHLLPCEVEEELLYGLVRRRSQFFLGEKFPTDEDNTHEFKSISDSRAPERSIAAYAGKYMVSFLNSSGGVLYCGIEDNGTICGVYMGRAIRDLTRLNIDDAVRAQRPPVESNKWKVLFDPVCRRVCGGAQPIRGLWIVRVIVDKGDSGAVYQTKDQIAWYRLQGSTRVMPADMIMNRQRRNMQKEQTLDMQSEIEKAVKRQVTEIMGAFKKDQAAEAESKLQDEARVAQEQSQQQSQTFDQPSLSGLTPQPGEPGEYLVETADSSNAPGAIHSSPSSQVTLDPRMVETVVSMGFEESEILVALFHLKREKQDANDINLVIDRLERQRQAPRKPPAGYSIEAPDLSDADDSGYHTIETGPGLGVQAANADADADSGYYTVMGSGSSDADHKDDGSAYASDAHGPGSYGHMTGDEAISSAVQNSTPSWMRQNADPMQPSDSDSAWQDFGNPD